MAGVPGGLPAGIRLTDHIGLGVIARAISPERVREVLVETGTASERERDLPAQVMVYYVIALALYMGSSTREVLRCLLEGLRWLWGAEAVRVAGKSGISRLRPSTGCKFGRRLRWSLVRPPGVEVLPDRHRLAAVSARPSPRSAYNGAGPAIHRFARAAPHRSAG